MTQVSLLDHSGFFPDQRACAFSTRRDVGRSEGVFGRFNIDPYCGDRQDAVLGNRRTLADQLGIAADRLFLPHQVHGAAWRVVDAAFLSKSDSEQAFCLEGVDALLTDVPSACVGVSTADCIPVLIYDPVRHAVAAVHSGWRGTVQRIAVVALRAMADRYQTSPGDVFVVIGPGISMESFEVGDSLYDRFSNQGYDMNVIARQYPARTPDEDGMLRALKWHLDLKAAIRQDLYACGVQSAHVHDCAIDTFLDHDHFFSARQLGRHCGRIYNGILLR